jgi:hypothetical protein
LDVTARDMDEVLDSGWTGRGRNRKLEYLVKWTGYDQPLWEPAENVNELEAVDRFHKQYPGKPEPLPEDA